MTTQAELIAAVAKDAGVSQADAGKVLTAIVEQIHASLTAGGDVRISNLGVFDTAARAEREGRNPATGATIKIAASKAVRFRVSKPLKDAVNKYDRSSPSGEGKAGGKGQPFPPVCFLKSSFAEATQPAKVSAEAVSPPKVVAPEIPSMPFSASSAIRMAPLDRARSTKG